MTNGKENRTEKKWLETKAIPFTEFILQSFGEFVVRNLFNKSRFFSQMQIENSCKLNYKLGAESGFGRSWHVMHKKVFYFSESMTIRFMTHKRSSALERTNKIALFRFCTRNGSVDFSINIFSLHKIHNESRNKKL